MKKPITKAELKSILTVLKLKPKDIIRTSEADYKDNGLSDIQDDDNKMIDAIIRYPKILERPIIINGDRGVIGRPPEKVLEII